MFRRTLEPGLYIARVTWSEEYIRVGDVITVLRFKEWRSRASRMFPVYETIATGVLTDLVVYPHEVMRVDL